MTWYCNMFDTKFSVTGNIQAEARELGFGGVGGGVVKVQDDDP